MDMSGSDCIFAPVSTTIPLSSTLELDPEASFATLAYPLNMQWDLSFNTAPEFSTAFVDLLELSKKVLMSNFCSAFPRTISLTSSLQELLRHSSNRLLLMDFHCEAC